MAGSPLTTSNMIVATTTASGYHGGTAGDMAALGLPYSSAPLYSLPAMTSAPPLDPSLISGGRMSPRMTYGLWFDPDRSIRVVHPPRDIVPYVGDGLSTLAGAIFWTGMGYSLNALRTILNARFRGIVINPDEDSSDDESNGGGDDEFSPASPSPDVGPFHLSHQPVDGGRVMVGGSDDQEDDEDSSEANTENRVQTQTQMQQTLFPPSQQTGPRQNHQRQKAQQYRRRVRRAQQAVTRMFGPTLRLVSDQAVYDIIHARFAWRSKGWIAGDHPGRDPEAPMRLFATILRDLDHTAAFGEAHLWLTPVDVEAYVQHRLRLTPAGWEPWAAALQGRGTAARTGMIRQLVDTIALAGMCFGDGPRFRPDRVTELVELWINGVALGVDGVGFWF